MVSPSVSPKVGWCGRNAKFLRWLTVLLAWAPPCGFLFGLHWCVLFCIARVRRDRIAAGLFWFLYLLACILLAVGGTWCRSSGRYVPCPGGEEMSRSCLFSTQPIDYILIYTAHYVGLAWLAVAWVLDGYSLLPWMIHDSGGAMRTFGSQTALASPFYPATITMTVSIVTLTWTTFVEWSTADGSGPVFLGELALLLFAVMSGCGAMSAAFLHYRDKKRRVGIKMVPPSSV